MDSVRKEKYKRPAVTVDAIIEKDGRILLIKRKNEPYRGRWALPGGFIEYGESAEDAIKREALEETNLKLELIGLMGVYSEPGRDPRGHVVSICFRAEGQGEEKSGSDAMDARLFKLEEALKEDLAFDHEKILRDYARLANDVL
ncbi:MAG: NUDIX domain-containing protein [Candidatus Hydrothermarchaeales archaeon]